LTAVADAHWLLVQSEPPITADGVRFTTPRFMPEIVMETPSHVGVLNRWAYVRAGESNVKTPVDEPTRSVTEIAAVC